jgi:hypothetical protein
MSGSAWTNQVQFLVIVAGGGVAGVYVYDLAPGAGNLIASMTDSLTGPFGETTEKGVTSYPTFSGDKYAVNLNTVATQGPGVSIQDLTNPPNAPAGMFGAASSASLATIALISGKDLSTDVQAAVTVSSQDTTGITNGAVTVAAGSLTIGTQIAAPAAPGIGFSFYADASKGVPGAVLVSGLAGQLPLVQTDLSSHAAGNNNTATDITKTWTIPAADAAAGTIYTLRTFITANTGQTTIETLTLGIDLNGTKTALATLGVTFNGGALNTGYDIPVALVIAADANGVDTPQVILDATLADISANRLSTNSANMHGHANVLTFTKANSNTVALYAQWGGAGGSDQSAATVWSELTRTGP